jgi:hypothetical protein
MAGNIEYDENKLRELILLICRKCADDPTFDEEKLKMLLYQCDFRSFAELGRAITGAVYVREPD